MLIFGVSVLLVLVALYVSVKVPLGTGAARSDRPPDAPPYAARGPYPVGVHEVAMDSDAPLDMVLWYPAADGVNPEARITYPYRIGMPAPLGLIKHVTTAFLLAELKQDTDAAAALAPGNVAFPGVTYEAQGY
jgi:hypothetical protein